MRERPLGSAAWVFSVAVLSTAGCDIKVDADVGDVGVHFEAAGGGGSSGTGGTVGGGGSGGAAGTGGVAGGESGGAAATGGAAGSGGSDVSDAGISDAGNDGGSTSAVQCGSTNIDFTGFTAAESVVVGPDGTVYSCSRTAALGRFAPPYSSPENTWVTISNAQVFGIALDPKKKVLYAGARSTNKVYRIPVDAPVAEELAPTMGNSNGINGVTLGEDGAVYYSDQSGGNVYRLNPDDKTTVQVTKTTIGNANGIAFAPPPDGRLWVVTYTVPSTVVRFQLGADHTEVDGSRDSFTISSSRADGIAFDKAGNAYITAGGLWKATPDQQLTNLNQPGGANVEFGAGALSCNLMLWASGQGVYSRTNDIAGADVPWHRP